MTRVALISATPAAIAPAVTGLADVFPEAEPWNLLDDKLLADARTGGPSPRMSALIRYAVSSGADGVLLTCSLYGEAARSAGEGVPVLAPDDAAFAEVTTRGYRHVLVVASFDEALADSMARLKQAADGVYVSGAVSPDAFQVTDPEVLVRALRETCARHAPHVDAVLLAQYSLAPAARELAAGLGRPVISGPHTAAAHLKALLQGGRP
ncbi:hypothetical protein [Nonomuraea typhae]|uniref:hypothetical protein n=1 Tax=Nonomuraea typhae TaxID=2603600 RepID=UPI0012F8121F|nr:hypothetical protein [Nonomuraea typhae]